MRAATLTIGALVLAAAAATAATMAATDAATAARAGLELLLLLSRDR